ncbi:tetratricopeptide repeat protein [Paraburkholderia sp. RP-4-7]|uniref:Tetratricopeptide repeat protein n=1 Tax=Paraburkholderia polaris TaxID=2728848 RepID=A0A848IPP0_9BURK|nr:tetratricopeptide repeat-containing glycosyltransferase family protein [Paraburkholderia polaris]NMM04232.1 tetratricopeptide repeat protein [Paraburkholderia polaris]
MSKSHAANRDPASIATLVSYADVDFSAHRMSDARNGYLQVLAAYPHNAHALHRMGLVCAYLNEMAEASVYLERALQAAPTSAELWEHAGLVAALKGEYAEAEAFYRHALHIAGSTATLHRNLADCLRQSGRLAEAKEHYEKAISIEPNLHYAILAVARISSELGETVNSASYLLRAWMLAPGSLRDGLDLITALVQAGREDEVNDVVELLSKRYANDAEALRFISGTLNENHRYADGLRLARRGLSIDLDNHFLFYNAARALWMCGRTRECFPYAMEAARLWPDNDGKSVQYFVSCVQLALGDFFEGWKRHKIFYTYQSIANHLVRPEFPEWNGEQVAGSRFLYVLHQGFGDQIQFLRFAEWLHQQGATVDVLVDPPLAGVAASMTGVRTVYCYPSVPNGPYEYWSYMLRIPEYMNLRISMLPIAMPYIAATQERHEHWRTYIEATAARTACAKKRRVGFVWQGSPNTANDRFRSISLETLRPLFDLPSITWFSVQKGNGEEGSTVLADEFDVHTLGPLIEDFSDTLAILETLDLLITVDSSTAHLAGAAGLPVWVFQPAYSEWRWLVNRTDSPWYPSMRLFPQRELGQWDTVIEEVREALLEMSAEEVHADR